MKTEDIRREIDMISQDMYFTLPTVCDERHAGMIARIVARLEEQADRLHNRAVDAGVLNEAKSSGSTVHDIDRGVSVTGTPLVSLGQGDYTQVITEPVSVTPWLFLGGLARRVFGRGGEA